MERCRRPGASAVRCPGAHTPSGCRPSRQPHARRTARDRAYARLRRGRHAAGSVGARCAGHPCRRWMTSILCEAAALSGRWSSSDRAESRSAPCSPRSLAPSPPRTTHVLWLLIGATASRDEIGIACWAGDRRQPRLLALLARPSAIVASDAESLCAMEAAAAGDDLTGAHAMVRAAGTRGALPPLLSCAGAAGRRLARSLPRMPDAARAELALTATSRLLFLSFLQAKGWLDGDRAFLANQFDRCMARAGGFHQRVMLPLFFGTLNTPRRDRRAPTASRFGSIPFLNGGLFSRTPLERRHGGARFSDEALGAAVRRAARRLPVHRARRSGGVVGSGRGSGDARARIRVADGGSRASHERCVLHAAAARGTSERTGAGRSALRSRGCRRAWSSVPLPERPLGGDDASRAPPSDSSELTVLDPACGSGAFLVHLLERLAALQQIAGDSRPVGAIRREVLARSIHGLDVNPMAVWLCELRLWLSVVIETRRASDVRRCTTPEPRLQRARRRRARRGRVRCAAGGHGTCGRPAPPPRALRTRDGGAQGTAAARARARGARCAPWPRSSGSSSHSAPPARELLLSRRARRPVRGTAITRRCRRSRPRRELRARASALRRELRRLADGGAVAFSFPSHFAHVHARGGFDLVIGNPPWVRLHNIPPASRAALRAAYRVFRERAWQPTTAEASARVRRPGGSCRAVRRAVSRVGGRRVSAGESGIGGAARPRQALALAVRRPRSSPARRRRTRPPCGGLDRLHPRDSMRPSIPPPSSFRADGARMRASRSPCAGGRWTSSGAAIAADLSFDRADDGEPVAVPAPRCSAKLRSRAGTRHQPRDHDARSGHARREVRLQRRVHGHGIGAASGAEVQVEHRGRTARLEAALVRPLLRGDAVVPWRVPVSARAIVWTHEDGRFPLVVRLPSGAGRWLAPWKRRLRARTDLRGSGVWWMLFRTEAADSSRARVVWSDLGRAPRAAILSAGDPTVPLNSCYVLPCDDPADAMALMALLNTPLAAAWLHALAEPARGGWRRFMAWTVTLLPLPRDWEHARSILVPVAEAGLRGDAPTDEVLLAAACRAYRLRRSDVEPLVAWCR